MSLRKKQLPPPQETEAAPAEPEEPQAEEPAEPAAPVEPTATQKAQDLINALPDAESITAENRADVEAQLTAIDEAKSALTDEEQDTLDFAKYQAAINALDALDGQTGASEPETMDTLDEWEIDGGPFQLTEDIGKYLTLNAGSTLDLNGYVFTGSISVMPNGSLAVNDSNSDTTHTGDYATYKGGVFGGDINALSSNVTINGGTFVNCTAVAATVGTINVNDGTFYNLATNIDVSSTINVNGGLFYGSIPSDASVKNEKITFKNNDTVYAEEVLGSAKASYAPADPTKEGCNFLGWYDSEGNKYTFGSTISGDITLTAKWETNVSTADGLKTAFQNGGNIILTDDVTISETLTIVGDKAVTLDLNGHVIKVTGGNGIEVSEKGSNDNNSLTLNDSNPTATHSGEYAGLPAGGVIDGKMTASTHSSVVINGGTINGDLDLRNSFGSCTMNGGAIRGNIHGDNDPNSRMTINGGILYGQLIYIATKTTNGLEVTFKNGDDTYATEYVPSGQTATKPIAPTREGYVFAGWQTYIKEWVWDGDAPYTGNTYRKEVQVDYNFDTPVTDHLTLYAAWEEIITVAVPYTTTVKQGDNTAPGEMTFELEIFDRNASEEGFDDVTVTATVETNGTGDYTSNLTITGPQSQIETYVGEGFFVQQKQGSEANWKYDDAVYYVERVWSQADSIEFEVYATEYEDKTTVDMKFVNVYTLHTHVHSYSQKYNESQHWEECDCGDKQNEELHQFGEWVVTKEATETEEGAQERTCTVCPYKQTEIIPMLPHTHQYDQQFDADSHWMECPCGDIQELEEHQFGEWVVTREPTTDELGEQERVCSVCGYSETEDLPALVEDESSNNSSNSNKTGSTKTTSAKTGSPKTGDEMSLSTMVAALVLSGAAIIALVVTGKKYGEHQ